MGRKRTSTKSARTTVADLTLKEQQFAHANLSLSLMRAQTVLRLSEELSPAALTEGVKTFQKAIATVTPTDAIRGHQAVWLYLGCAEAAMELWEARVFSDKEITKRLNHPQYRRLLTGARDVVFHALYIDEPRMRAFEDNWDEVQGWASAILDDMKRYVEVWYARYFMQRRRKGAPRRK